MAFTINPLPSPDEYSFEPSVGVFGQGAGGFEPSVGDFGQGASGFEPSVGVFGQARRQGPAASARVWRISSFRVGGTPRRLRHLEPGDVRGRHFRIDAPRVLAPILCASTMMHCCAAAAGGLRGGFEPSACGSGFEPSATAKRLRAKLVGAASIPRGGPLCLCGACIDRLCIIRVSRIKTIGNLLT